MAPKRNGFWYFMADFKKQAEAAGRTFPGGFRDVQSDPECSQQWRLLTDQEKKKYNARAKREYGNRPKLTCWGESIAEVEAREKRRAEYEENMRRDIAETINLAVLSKTIAETPFYFIHANYFYAKEDADTTLHYVPAEMAICEFSMSAGCKRFYHQIIKIDVELGYARETMEHAEQTHKLPPDYAGGEKDYKVILRKFQEFLEPERIRTGKMPPVYSSRKHKPVVNDFLERLAKTASAPDWTGHQEVPNLYTLEILFGKLMVASNAELMMYLCNPTILAECELDKGAFAYTPNIECTYHQRIEETSIYCSLGIIRQWVFLICDYCCHRMGIKMIKEVHCPANAATDDIEILVTHMADLGLKKEHKSGSVKSATGVTQAYREAKAGRTARDEERRRIAALKAPPLTIIDHGQLLQPASSMSSLTSSISESCQLAYLKPLRVPKTLATVVKSQESPPSINPDNFPPINSRKLFGSRLLAGRGRGGVPAGN